MMPALAAAGNAGPNVRSDCLVTFEPGGDGIEVNIETGAESVPLERAVRITAARLGVGGRVAVDDSGAEPFTVAARFEAAARKALEADLPLPPPSTSFRPSERSRPRRSRLYLPGNRPDFISKALSSGADGLILDLEDSVSPDRKFEARILVAHALASVDFGETEVMVRINQGDEGLEDLRWIIPQPVQHVLIPKVESAAEVAGIRDRALDLASACGRGGLPWFMPIIESPGGILDAPGIARAIPECAALTLGLQDLTAELGVRPTSHGRESFVARSLVILAARAAGLQPIDTVYADVKNEEGLRASVAEARELGFVGKGCIHPAQVPVVNGGFLPDEETVAQARKVVLAMEDAHARGLGAVTLGSRMIDPAVARQAAVVIADAVRFGILPADWRDSPVD